MLLCLYLSFYYFNEFPVRVAPAYTLLLLPHTTCTCVYTCAPVYMCWGVAAALMVLFSIAFSLYTNALNYARIILDNARQSKRARGPCAPRIITGEYFVLSLSLSPALSAFSVRSRALSLFLFCFDKNYDGR